MPNDSLKQSCISLTRRQLPNIPKTTEPGRQAGEKDMLCPTAIPCQLVAMCEIRPRSTPDVAKKYRDRAERPNGGPRTADNTTWLC